MCFLPAELYVIQDDGLIVAMFSSTEKWFMEASKHSVINVYLVIEWLSEQNVFIHTLFFFLFWIGMSCKY